MIIEKGSRPPIFYTKTIEKWCARVTIIGSIAMLIIGILGTYGYFEGLTPPASYALIGLSLCLLFLNCIKCLHSVKPHPTHSDIPVKMPEIEEVELTSSSSSI